MQENTQYSLTTIKTVSLLLFPTAWTHLSKEFLSGPFYSSSKWLCTVLRNSSVFFCSFGSGCMLYHVQYIKSYFCVCFFGCCYFRFIFYAWVTFKKNIDFGLICNTVYPLNVFKLKKGCWQKFKTCVCNLFFLQVPAYYYTSMHIIDSQLVYVFL